MGPDSGGGIPGWFITLAILVPVIGILGSVWRYSVVKKLGRDAGLSDGQSTAMALLGQDGVDTAILASTINRQHAQPPAATVPTTTPAASPTRSTEERLRELQGLKDRGVITASEYDTRRSAIIGSI
jgi:hypothetical protein